MLSVLEVDMVQFQGFKQMEANISVVKQYVLDLAVRTRLDLVKVAPLNREFRHAGRCIAESSRKISAKDQTAVRVRMLDWAEAPNAAGHQKNWSPDFPHDILPLVAICTFLIH